MARAKGLKGADLEKSIRKARDDSMPNTPAGMRKDRFSHFILRLAYCRRRERCHLHPTATPRAHWESAN